MKGLFGFAAFKDLVVVQIRQHKRTRVVTEQRVQGFQILTGRALIVSQGQALTRRGAGAEVDVQIGVAKGVDRLLRITDEQQGTRVFIDAIENTVLQRIGILEFIDERKRKASPDVGRKRRTRVTLQLIE